MIKILEQDVMKIAFQNSLDIEELILKKYEEYIPDIKDKEILKLLNEFKENANQHKDLLQVKIVKLKLS